MTQYNNYPKQVSVLTPQGVRLKLVGNRKERRRQVARSRKLVKSLAPLAGKLPMAIATSAETLTPKPVGSQQGVSNDRPSEAGSPDKQPDCRPDPGRRVNEVVCPRGSSIEPDTSP